MGKYRFGALLLAAGMLLSSATVLAEELQEYMPEEPVVARAADEPLTIENAASNDELNEAIRALSDEEYEEAIRTYRIDPMRFANGLTDDSKFDGLPDEKFFGTWDGEKWTLGPTINYDYVDPNGPDLSAVEAAAKAGDYALAKQEWLNYARAVESYRVRPMMGSNDETQHMTAELMYDRVYWNSNSNAKLVDVLTIGNEAADVEIDLNNVVSYIKEAASQEVTFYLASVYKDGSRAEFDSINSDSGKGPVLEITSNGATQKFYPTDDATISGDGLHEKTASKRNKYGMLPTLELEESVSSIGEARVNVNECNCDDAQAPLHTRECQIVDDGTKRALIKFKLDGAIAADANVTNATLRLHGRNASGQGTMKFFVLITKENSQETGVPWSEETVDWWWNRNLDTNADPVKEDSDNERNYARHIVANYNGRSFSSWCKPSGTTRRFRDEYNRFTGNINTFVQEYMWGSSRAEEYAARAVQDLYFMTLQIGTVSVSNDTYGGGKHARNRLDFGARTPTMVQYIKRLINCDAMTPEVYTILSKYCWRSGYVLSGWITSSGNWGGYEEAGNYAVVCEFPEFQESPQWEENVMKYIEQTALSYVRDDLSCIEVPLQYANVAKGTITSFESIKKDVGSEEPPYNDAVAEALHNLTRYVMYSSGPGYRDHQQGDSAQYTRSYAGGFMTEAVQFNDPELLYAATGGTKGQAPPFESIIFKSGKKVVMRTGWDERANYLFTQMDGGYSSHGQQDDHAISLFAYGKYLIADTSYTGAQGEANNWLKSAAGHSLVQIDGKDQLAYGSSKMGTINDWGSNDHYDFYSGTTPNYSTAGVEPTREILFVKPGFWIVSDYLVPDSMTTPHTYEQRWIMMPDANMSIDEGTNIVRSNYDDVNIQVVPVASSTYDSVGIEDGLMGGGTGVLNNTQYADYEKTQKTGVQTFNTILFPEDNGQNHSIVTKPLAVSEVENEGASAFNFTITDNHTGKLVESNYYLLHDKAQRQERSFGDYTFNGQLAYVEKTNGGLSAIILRDVADSDEGLKLTDAIEGRTLVQTTVPVQDLSIRYNGDLVEIQTHQDISMDARTVTIRGIDTAGLNFYAPYEVQQVKIDGTIYQKGKDFHQDGTTVYFEEKFMEEEPISPTPTPSPTYTAPSHGGGGSGSSGGGGSTSGGGGSTVVTPTATPTPTPTANPTAGPEQTPTPAVTPDLSELEGHWAQQEIQTLVEQHIVSGDENGKLNLQDTMTRAEFLAMVLRGLEAEFTPYTGGFADVPADAWYADVMQTAYDLGYIEGDGTGVNPEGSITREEMAKILVEIYEAFISDTSQPENDVGIVDENQISEWAKDYVQKAYSYGLISGMPDGSFAPQEHMLREQGMAAVYRMLNKTGRLT